MKIYVSELPKCCNECCFYKLNTYVDIYKEQINSYECVLGGSMLTNNCPLLTTQSIKQQVREEVVEEIKEKFNDTLKHHFCPNPSSVDFITLCISEVEEFLEQVKG